MKLALAIVAIGMLVGVIGGFVIDWMDGRHNDGTVSA